MKDGCLHSKACPEPLAETSETLCEKHLAAQRERGARYRDRQKRRWKTRWMSSFESLAPPPDKPYRFGEPNGLTDF